MSTHRSISSVWHSNYFPVIFAGAGLLFQHRASLTSHGVNVSMSFHDDMSRFASDPEVVMEASGTTPASTSAAAVAASSSSAGGAAAPASSAAVDTMDAEVPVVEMAAGSVGTDAMLAMAAEKLKAQTSTLESMSDRLAVLNAELATERERNKALQTGIVDSTNKRAPHVTNGKTRVSMAASDMGPNMKRVLEMAGRNVRTLGAEVTESARESLMGLTEEAAGVIMMASNVCAQPEYSVRAREAAQSAVKAELDASMNSINRANSMLGLPPVSTPVVRSVPVASLKRPAPQDAPLAKRVAQKTGVTMAAGQASQGVVMSAGQGGPFEGVPAPQTSVQASADNFMANVLARAGTRGRF